MKDQHKKIRSEGWIFENVPDGISIYEKFQDSSRKLIDCNSKYVEMSGYSREELMGMEDTIDIQEVHTTPEEEAAKTENTLAGQAYSGVFSWIRPDGKENCVEFTANTVQEGDKTFILGIDRDITERKRMENEFLNAQKLEAIGVLAGGIANNFNNILTGILGNISLAGMDLERGKAVDGVLDNLTRAEEACFRAAGLTQRLLTFSSSGAPVTKEASITALLRRSAEEVEGSPDVRCELYIPDDLWPLQIDEGQMEQAIRNLVANAGQAMPNGGAVEIRAENLVARSQDAIELEDGEYVMLSIADRGVGIPEERLQRIFDPFFTTKAGASGLGLTISYSIVNRHHGLITVESQEGIGTTIHVYLPTTSGADDTAKVEEGEDESAIYRGRILVMDDEEIIRELVAEVFGDLGHEVMIVTNGSDAVKAYRQARDSERPFDAVILDLTIPGGMGGKKTIRKLQTIDTEVKAVVASGYSDDPIMTNFRRYGFKDAIAKPYTVGKLRAVLSKVLASNAS